MADIFDQIEGKNGDIFDQITKKDIGPLQNEVPDWGKRNPNLYGAYGAGGAIINRAVRPMAETAGMIAGAGLGGPGGAALGYGIVKKGMDIGESAYKGLEKSVEPKTITEEMLGSAWDVGSTYAFGKGTELLAKAIRPIDEKITEAIRTGISKGIKPSVQGKATGPQVERYYQKAESAVKDIIQNNPDKLPTNLQEFSAAVQETKNSLYNNYHSMAVKAGQKGVEVDLTPIISEMKAIGSSPELIRANPNEARRMLQLASIWERMPTKISPIEAESLIANYNQQSKLYWKDPNPGSIQSSANAERIASTLRKQTDEMVSTYEGPGWQNFRDRYGSLTQIEKDVTHRSVIDERKNIKGFFDLTSVFSTGEFVRGLVTLDPGSLSKATAMHFTKKWIEKVNDPNRIVRNMFSDVSKNMSKLAPEEQIAFRQMLQLPEPAWQTGMQKQLGRGPATLEEQYPQKLLEAPGYIQSEQVVKAPSALLRDEMGPLKAKYRIGDFEGDITMVERDRPFLTVPKRIIRKTGDETKNIINEFRRTKGLPPI